MSGNVSVGQALGFVAGAVIGYFTGGAGWALMGNVMMGASIGYAAGSIIDPVSPDVPSPGQSNMGKLDITLADEGVVVPDALGTVKTVSNLFWYGNNRMVEITDEIEGGKGGSSQTVVTGHEYYLSWAQGICEGPIDEVISIFRMDDPVWQGNALLTDATNGKITIDIESMGTCHVMFGTDTQSPIDAMSEYLDDPTLNPAFRGFAWAYFDDCKIGNYNRCPTIKFVFRKTPDYAWSIDNRVGLYDYSPAHALYYIISEKTEIPASMIDTTSLATIASTLALEVRGISLLMGDELEAQQYIENILTHIGGLLKVRSDGKFYLSLLRDDIAEGSMDSITDDDFVDTPSIKRRAWTDTYNDIKVQYAKRVDRPFDDTPLDPIGAPDVYVMGFIDESNCPADLYTYAQCVANGSWSYAHTSTQYNGSTPSGDALPAWTEDIALYYDEEFNKKEMTWLPEGAYHYCALYHVDSETYSGLGSVVPFGYVASNYCDHYEIGAINDWATTVNDWKTAFQSMISNSRGVYSPGSVLRVYVDTSSMGGISSLEPAYSQFKTWVIANYGSLLYLEYPWNRERWMQALHEDLTPWGYGG